MATDAQSRNAGRAAYAAATAKNYRNVASDCEILKPRRRSLAKSSLLKFLRSYTPEPFYLPFSQSHLDLIEDVQQVILKGGRIAVAMPRGSGKTTILSRALLWATLYGHRRFPVLAVAADQHFRRALKSIKRLLLSSERLAEDFPEVIEPVRELEDKAVRVNGQHWDKAPTCMEWGAELIRFPYTPMTMKRGNAGIAIGGGGLLGSLRGLNTTLPTGEVVRPDCLLFDDVQTRRSAESMPQCQEREQAINDCIAMAGPGRSMAALMACTVIAEDDLSDRMLSVDRPDWLSHRVKTFNAFPDNMAKWDDYNAVRLAEKLGEEKAGAANKHYRKHRKQLDAGADHFWPKMVEEGKVSAIQTAMDQFLEDRSSFMSERQNEPERTQLEGDLPLLRVLDLANRTSEVPEGVVPTECTTLTAHIDVQSEILFYCLCGWTNDFAGHVITYGTVPSRSGYFTLDRINQGNRLSKAYPGNDEKGRVRAGIVDAIKQLNREWPTESGQTLAVSKILVDGGYLLDAVEIAVRDSGCPTAGVALGVGIGAARAPIAMWAKKPGQVNGNHWITRPMRGRRPTAHVDVNYWKTEVHSGLLVPQTHSQSIQLFKAPARRHQMFAEHCCGEKAIKVEALGRTVAEWLLKKPNIDNHYWDTLVGCMAAASMVGIRKAHEHNGQAKTRTPKKNRIRKLNI